MEKPDSSGLYVDYAPTVYLSSSVPIKMGRYLQSISSPGARTHASAQRRPQRSHHPGRNRWVDPDRCGRIKARCTTFPVKGEGLLPADARRSCHPSVAGVETAVHPFGIRPDSSAKACCHTQSQPRRSTRDSLRRVLAQQAEGRTVLARTKSGGPKLGRDEVFDTRDVA